MDDVVRRAILVLVVCMRRDEVEIKYREEPVFCQMPVISLYFARNENKCRIKIPIAELCRVMPSYAELCRVKMPIAEFCAEYKIRAR